MEVIHRCIHTCAKRAERWNTKAAYTYFSVDNGEIGFAGCGSSVVFGFLRRILRARDSGALQDPDYQRGFWAGSARRGVDGKRPWCADGGRRAGTVHRAGSGNGRIGGGEERISTESTGGCVRSQRDKSWEKEPETWV